MLMNVSFKKKYNKKKSEDNLLSIKKKFLKVFTFQSSYFVVYQLWNNTSKRRNVNINKHSFENLYYKVRVNVTFEPKNKMKRAS